MPRSRVDVLPGQLSLFDADKLQAASGVKPCPACDSPHVFVRRRVKVWEERVCGQCGREWGGPRGQPGA